MRPLENSRDLNITRLYNVTIANFWAAWSDETQKRQWWGPRGFSITTESMDFCEGGNWNYTMHAPDGQNIPNATTFIKIIPMKELIYDHGGKIGEKPLFRVHIHLNEVNNQTEMKMKMTFESPEIAKRMAVFIKDANGNSTWDRLGEYLCDTYQHRKIFRLDRVFEADIGKLYQLFVDKEAVEKWQPPIGFFMKIRSGSVAVGDHIFYEMGNGDFSLFGRSTYLVIKKSECIEFLQEFCDEYGNIAKHPGAPIWPKQWKTSVNFYSEGEKLTRISLISELLPETKDDECDAFINERVGMMNGWNGSLDRLENLI